MPGQGPDALQTATSSSQGAKGRLHFIYMPVYSNEFVILGITTEGKTFRPSDWAERLAGVMSSFGGGRLGYSPYCYPITSNNIKSVVVNAKLKAIEPMAYGFLLNFARDNELQVRHGRDKPRDGTDTPTD
jgi:hypothetical protein